MISNLKKLLNTRQVHAFSDVYLDHNNQYIFEKMIKKKITDLLMGHNMMFIAFGVPNSGKSFSTFGNKLLCDPYFLEFIESIPSKGEFSSYNNSQTIKRRINC